MSKRTYLPAALAIGLIRSVAGAQVARQSVSQTVTPALQHSAVDSLHRYAIGIDTDNADLLASAFTTDVHVDFTPAADAVGLTFPVLEGRDMTIGALAQISDNFVTSHSVSNDRIQVTEDGATLFALVEAHHVPNGNRESYYVMKNAYNAQLAMEDGTWKIFRLVIDNLWDQGSVEIMTGG